MPSSPRDRVTPRRETHFSESVTNLHRYHSSVRTWAEAGLLGGGAVAGDLGELGAEADVGVEIVHPGQDPGVSVLRVVLGHAIAVPGGEGVEADRVPVLASLVLRQQLPRGEVHL